MDAATPLLRSIAEILEVLGAFLFIILLFLIYVHCILPAYSKLRGLSGKERENLPEIKGRELCLASECCICLESVEPDDPVRLLPACSHGFHSKCIDTWLSSKPLCPLCRSNVRLEPPVPAGDSGSMV